MHHTRLLPRGPDIEYRVRREEGAGPRAPGQPSHMRARVLWEWHPPVVTAQQNPPEWEELGWHELLSVVEERCYPWNSEEEQDQEDRREKGVDS